MRDFGHFIKDKLKDKRKRRRVIITFLSLVAGLYYFLLPKIHFDTPASTVLNDKDGHLLSARIAADGQWRFPPPDSIPDKFAQCIIHFEDQHFYQHIGFNPASLLRALRQNILAGKIVSGGSTLSMQVIRLSRRHQQRSIWEKIKEIILSTRLEIRHSKAEILKLYATNAPFGGNIVGLETASWRYFGRNAHQLSWAESATLAVLPNQPALIFPGRNQQKLKLKRDFVLRKLHSNNLIDSLTLVLALDEPLPGKPYPIPQLSNHLMDRAIKEGHKGQTLRTTINVTLQKMISNIINQHGLSLKANEIHNAAAIVLSVNNGEVLAYVGNITNSSSYEHGNQVDIIASYRSTGSILKPFLYAAMIDEGMILPGTLLPDIPTFIKGFAPKNFSGSYEGAVPAKTALSRSLNIPAVTMLQDFGVSKFHHLLKQYGMASLSQPPGHYGLSLILGGAEGSLWDITGMYAQAARTINKYFLYPEPYRYNDGDLHPPYYIHDPNRRVRSIGNQQKTIISAGAIWSMTEAMLEVYRPGDDASWKYFDSAQKIAWKTGTSFGFRDGWAIGFTPQHVVGVWVGNADGEGRPGLTGIKTAGPILFDIFDILPASRWFNRPGSELVKLTVCRETGFRDGINCPNVDTLYNVRKGLATSPCPYHKLIHLESTGRFRVNSNCEAVENIIQKPWLVLPPVQAYYYKTKSPNYKALPPFRQDCETDNSAFQTMQVIFPKNKAKLLIPRSLSGEKGKVVFEVAHDHNNIEIHWHLDDKFINTTKRNHQLGLNPSPGKHVLTLVDANGQVLVHHFEILGHDG